jgi:hypothetical protein
MLAVTMTSLKGRVGVKAKLYTSQEANKAGEFRPDYWIRKEKSEVLTLQRTADSRR